MSNSKWRLPADRYFGPDPTQRGIARKLYTAVRDLPLVCPHGHVDPRAFPSIPARHDVWRRVGANWLAGLVVRGIVDVEDAHEMILDTAYRLARRAYKFKMS